MNSLLVRLQHALPQLGLTRFAGRAAASERPWLRDRLIRRFVRSYDVDMSEAERPLGEYRSFNDFFTRALKPGARPLADATRHVLSPADGTISQLGRIRAGRVLQAKGHDYTVTELLGGDAALAARFGDGDFVTVYLSPKDYHRVHMPADGTLRATSYIPGDLFSVNTATAAGVPGLFARNERLVCLFENERVGPFVSVMVGALIVAGIETVWSGRITRPHDRRPVSSEPGEAVRLEAGAEMGRFLLGSTVILLFGEGLVTWRGDLEAGSAVRMGEALGVFS